MVQSAIKQVKIKRITQSETEIIEDSVAVEEPLEIQLVYGVENQRLSTPISVTMRTPGNDVELALGFLVTEGILKSINEVEEAKQNSFDQNKVLVTLKTHVQPELKKLERNFYTSSSCGVCGKSSIEAVTIACERLPNDTILIGSDSIKQLAQTIRNEQNLFSSTGGIHASALVDLNGNFLFLREDVGRHNALDKLIGYALLKNMLPLNQHILVLSGRASFELLQKSAIAGIKIVVAIGAPSSLAIQLAHDFNITLIGFVKAERFNIYSGEQRIIS
ncbi:MAG: formate dehydrogenase accessory sulfurtransferase FdhD [Bacteroidetes bacterium]|nr:formate dehydrogenase accessory sulfurtransferase FdhD [Bacteroidota bacterium]MBK9673400.1 formate dehydrogenase accessory sulfurtransferase FdhD [Bacteroidota bacterium]MBP6411951.1 formate dehydrogenase accessory sulfurtransferase FdhD [Bacteroidia bacterium]